MNQSSSAMIVDTPFEVGEETPFGLRWGGKVIMLSEEHLDALKDGRYVAIDVENEYVEFLMMEKSPTLLEIK